MKKLVTLAAMTTMSALAFAHAKLQSSTPADGATVAVAPSELRLAYNEPVEVAMSTIKVSGPGDAAVTLDKVTADSSDEKVLVQHLPKLSAGEYRVEWSTMGHDGHHRKGELRFTVK